MNTTPSGSPDTGKGRSGGFGKWVGWLGPGFITAALVLGPGSITISSTLGASFGYSLLWVILISTIFMITFVGMSIRISLATDCSLLTTIREKWGNPVAVIIGIGIFLVTASFQAGNAVGAGLAFSELSDTHITPWIITFSLASISLLYFKQFYKILEKLMLVLVGVMLLSFLGTLIIVKPSLSGITGGLVPAIPSGSLMLAVALVASSFSMGGAFYQSYLVKEKKWKREEHKQAKYEGVSGIAVLGLISAIILICAATVLQPLDITITSAADMGLAIEPLFGGLATTLFMMGLFGASFSSLIGNATVGGTLLSDALGFGSRLSDRNTRLFIMAVMIIGAIVAVWFGGIPIDLIVFAQGVTIFVVPFVGIILYMTAANKEIVGEFHNSTRSNIFGFLGLVFLITLAFMNAKALFF